MKYFSAIFNKQRGIGLLELMLSLAIIALLLLMAMRFYTAVKRSQEVNQAVTDIGFILGGIENWKGPTGSYVDLESYKVLADAGYSPDDISVGNSNSGTTPAWDGCTASVTLEGTATNATLTFDKLSSPICKAMEMRIASSSSLVRSAVCTTAGTGCSAKLVLITGARVTTQ